MALRTLPLAAYAWTAAAPRPVWLRALISALALVALGAAASGVDDSLVLVGALVAAAIYFCAAALLTHAARAHRIAELIDPASLLTACVALYLIAPSFLLRGWLNTSIVVLGFDFALSAYSYLVSAPGDPRRLSDCLVFILVDPQLVYTRRSLPCSPANARTGWQRCALALVVLGLTEVAALRLSDASNALVTLTSQTSYPSTFALLWPILLVQYMGLSGAASLQIGVLRLLGVQVTERFRYPLVASSPSEFWQRWNRYGSEWFKVHVFAPVAGSRLSRRLRLRPTAAWAIAVLVVFFVNGMLHVVTVQLIYGRIDVRPLLGFVGFGTTIIAFDLVRRLSRFTRSWRGPMIVARMTGVLVTLHIVLLLGWFLFPLG